MSVNQSINHDIFDARALDLYMTRTLLHTTCTCARCVCTAWGLDDSFKQRINDHIEHLKTQLGAAQSQLRYCTHVFAT